MILGSYFIMPCSLNAPVRSSKIYITKRKLISFKVKREPLPFLQLTTFCFQGSMVKTLKLVAGKGATLANSVSS